MSDKLVDSDVTWLGFLEGGFADPTTPTVTEALEAFNFTCAAAKGYTLGPIASSVLDLQSVCDTAPDEVFTQDNYQAQFDLYNEGDPDAEVENSVFLEAREVFAERGVSGDIIRRLWTPSQPKGYADAPTSGDVIDIFRVRLDHPRDLSGQTGDAAQLTSLEFKQAGGMWLRRSLVAGGG